MRIVTVCAMMVATLLVATSVPTVAQQKKSTHGPTEESTREHPKVTYVEKFGAEWDRANPLEDVLPDEFVIYGGDRYISPGEDPRNREALEEPYAHDYFCVYLEGRTLYFHGIKDGARITKETISPRLDWEEFWKAVKRAKLKEWEEAYVPRENAGQDTTSPRWNKAGGLIYPNYWGIKIKYRGITYDTEGDNAYPDERQLSRETGNSKPTAPYKTIMKALVKLLELWDGLFMETPGTER